MYQRILVPIDGSPTSNCGLNEAIKFAKGQGGTIRLLHVVNEYVLDCATIGTYAGDLIDSLRETGQKIVAEAQAVVQNSGLQCDSVMLESLGGSASDLIIEQAKLWPADLIVMGTHGRRGLRRIAMGSDAESVVREASVPILLINAGHKPN